MARNLIKPDTRPVTLPRNFPPMPAVARILSRHDRDKLAAFVTVAIDLLDVLDGDPDREGECSEDEVSRCTDMGLPVRGNGPGCDIADTGEEDDPAGQYDEDAWTSDLKPGDPDGGAGCPISDPGEYEDGH